jgi:Ser/Thr protein kinase RdoA (MazF antagonist)
MQFDLLREVRTPPLDKSTRLAAPQLVAADAPALTIVTTDLVGRPDLVIVSAHFAALQESTAPAGVPCHLDFQADNWFLDQAGDLCLIDFEPSRIDIPVVILSFRVSRSCDLRHRDGVHDRSRPWRSNTSRR